jgi:NADH-quinone oxidoreductase subunit L
MSPTTLALILLLPLAGFALQIFFGYRLIPRKGDWLATGLVGVSAVLAVSLFVKAFSHIDPGFLFTHTFQWINLGDFRISMGFMVDNLTIIMLTMVTVVSFLIHLYSTGYMHGDPKYSRFFAYLNLFVFSMLGIVLCDNLIALYIFWELVGLSSYLLIGFWYEKDSAANAAKKAFLTTRVGDVFMFIGIMLVYTAVGTFNFREIFDAVAHGEISGARLTVAGIFLFGGAVGKSAQFPLHVWLPDAMEGPTPVSALIHAATMVAAGVYMVGRLYPVFTPDALVFVAYIGLITAIMAATIAIVQSDIKRALAYSTISQLGYMVAALGVGGFVAGLFHLITHAFFKALLFLGSGSVIHAAHTQEMPEMGGLRRKMPITFWTFLIATAAISGIPPLSGFWSKDMILASALEFGMANAAHMVLAILLIIGAGITAFYMFRVVFLTFLGEPRDREKYDHAHESPWVMTVPLSILAFFSIIGGLGHWFEKMVVSPVAAGAAHGAHEAAAHGGEAAHGAAHTAHNIAMFSGLAVVAVGILLAWLIYGRRSISAEALGERFKPIYTVLWRKYYFDELYSAVFVRPCVAFARACGKFDNVVIDGAVNGSAFLTRTLSWFIGLFDNTVIDGAVNGVADVTRAWGSAIRRVQTGRFQNYALGLVILSFVILMWRIIF